MRSVASRLDIRDLILDATDHLLGLYGFRRMTMEEVAQQVGIGKGTIYLHFPSKQELVLSHIDRIVERVVARLWTIAKGAGPLDERLREMLRTRVLFRFDSVQHYRKSLAELLTAIRPALLARHNRQFMSEAEAFRWLLEAGRRAGAFACDDPAATADSLIVATNALLPFALSVRELGDRGLVEESVVRISNLVLAGLWRREAPTSAQRRPRDLP